MLFASGAWLGGRQPHRASPSSFANSLQIFWEERCLNCQVVVLEKCPLEVVAPRKARGAAAPRRLSSGAVLFGVCAEKPPKNKGVYNTTGKDNQIPQIWALTFMTGDLIWV